MSELYLRQPRFTYSAYEPFTKHRQPVQQLRETGNLKHIYKNGLYNTCFANDDAYSGSKYFAKRTLSDRTLKYRPYDG